MNDNNNLFKEFSKFNINYIEILQAFSKIINSNSDSVEVSITTNDGKSETFILPSLVYLLNELKRIDNNIISLSNFNSNGKSITIKTSDGTVKTYFPNQIINAPKIDRLIPPSTFFTKTNWFFDNFITPSLFINIDITPYIINSNVKNVFVKRIIINANTSEIIDFFNNNFNNKNDIVYENLLQQLMNNNITFVTDDEVINLPTGILRYDGNFDVINIFDTVTVNNTILRKYRFNTLSFTDNLSGVANSLVLRPGDILVKKDSKYSVEIVNENDSTVLLKKLYGNDIISLGVNELQIDSQPYFQKEAQISIGYDERQIVFLKAIDANINVTNSKWSYGFGFYSNDLKIAIDGNIKTLDDYYKSNVLDLGVHLKNIAKEKRISNFSGIIPEPPVLFKDNFKVLLINDHKEQNELLNNIRNQYEESQNIFNSINILIGDVKKIDNQLLNNKFSTAEEKRNLENEKSNKIKEKEQLELTYNNLINSIISASNTNNIDESKPKYRIRGFWEIPQPILYNKTLQNVIQFNYRYRYLKINNNNVDTKTIDYTLSSGDKVSGNFTNWILSSTKPRKKLFNEILNEYVWEEENTGNPDEINTNQIDIPITIGERVEIQIQSVSEAGYPENPLLSNYSDSIIIDFPEELKTKDVSQILNLLKGESERLKYQQELEFLGLINHVSDSTISNNKEYKHTSSNIDSGFKNSNGDIINLYDKLLELQNELKAIQNRIDVAKGKIKIYIMDGINKNEINNKQTAYLFAGFYTEELKKLQENEKKGAIISKRFTITIENEAASVLQLISKFAGTISEDLPTASKRIWKETSYIDDIYYKSLLYAEVPIVYSGITPLNNGSDMYNQNKNKLHPSPFQSKQLPSQYIYARKMSVDGNFSLFKSGTQDISYYPDLEGEESTLQATNVWDGTFSIQYLNSPKNNGIAGDYYVPNGGGKLTKFAVSIDHPDLYVYKDSTAFDLDSTSKTKLEILEYFNDPINRNENSIYPKFKHSEYFNLQSNSNNGKSQLEYKEITQYGNSLYKYPQKFGFLPNDRFLIGENTCGSYLYILPTTYENISTPGIDNSSTRKIEFGENNSIKIPIIFQYRMTDYFGAEDNKIGYVGGYKQNSDNSTLNLNYTKRIGLDIFILDENSISFDIECTAIYKPVNYSEYPQTQIK